MLRKGIINNIKPIRYSNCIRLYSTHSIDDNDSTSVNIHTYPLTKFNTIVNFCPQGYNIVKERFGKYIKTQDSGLFVSIPFLDTLRFVDMREMTISISPQSAITKDNVSVEIGGALYVQAVDPYKVCYGVRRPLVAVRTHAISAMRSKIGEIELDDLFHNRAILNKSLCTVLESACSPWGLKVMRHEVTDIIPDPEVSRAMDAQATAERRRREKIINADAQKKSEILESEGHKQKEINIAEGHRQRVILEAESEKAKQDLEAEGQALALERIAKILKTNEGRDAMNFQIAEEYFKTIGKGLGNSSTVFIPKDPADINSIIAKGMGIIGNMNKK